MSASLECGDLAPLCYRSRQIDNKAASGRRTPRRRPNLAVIVIAMQFAPKLATVVVAMQFVASIQQRYRKPRKYYDDRIDQHSREVCEECRQHQK